MAPGWLGVVAWITIAGGFLTAAAILYDMYGRGRRQAMRVMEAVWPITALYLGPLGWVAYARLGRPVTTADRQATSIESMPRMSMPRMSMPRMSMHTMSMRGEEPLPCWRGTAVTATHCGAGCALGDVIGEWLVFAIALSIAGTALWGEYIIDFAFGYVFGIGFQYWAIKPGSTLAPRAALRHAIEADTLSVIAFEAGMFAWMAFFQRVLFPQLLPNDPSYWLMMQVAMVTGLIATYPAQIWLIDRGIKERMGRPVVPAAAGTHFVSS